MSTQNQNKSNLVYFECPSMRELYEGMENWQTSNQQRFLSISIQKDKGKFCCVALIYPWDLMQTMQQQLKYESDMERFQHKALKRIGVAVSFESSYIPRRQILRLQRQLEKCATPEEVKAVFAEEL